MEDDVDHETAASLAVLATCGIVFFLLMLWVTSAPAKQRPELCLTYKEARHLWPKIHLYWYSSDRCWSNRRGPPRGLKFDPVFSSHAQEVMPKTGKQSEEHDMTRRSKPAGAVINIVRSDEVNEIDLMADIDTYFQAQPIEMWLSVARLDYRFNYLWNRRVGYQWDK